MGIASEVEKRDAFVFVGFVSVLMTLDLALAAILLLAPLVRHSFVEGRVHQPVELVDIHGVDAILEPLVFGLMALDRLLVLAAFIGVASVQRVAHPPAGGVDLHHPPGFIAEVEIKPAVEPADADMDLPFWRVEMRLGLDHV